VEFVERKLAEHGVAKVVPDEAALAEQYADALRRRVMEHLLDEIGPMLRDQVEKIVSAAPMQGDIGGHVRDRQATNPAEPWEASVDELVKASLVRS
jgi:hypothetical protein